MKNLKKRYIVLISLGVVILVAVIAVLSYLCTYYHRDASADVRSELVKVEEIDGGYFFDGPGEDKALIFYPGAKVDTLAYASLMNLLAENGVDCFLADMPFHIAFFGSNIGEKFLDNYEYDTWAIAGHSLGGVVASSFLEEHEEDIDSLILLASYPNNPVPETVTLYSVYGTNDGVLNMEAYENSREYWPLENHEYILAGGNHAQYANYGPQSGDMEALIAREDQQARTAEFILEAFT